MKKDFIFTILLGCLFSSATIASSAQDDFYAISENENKFKSAIQQGKIDTARQRLSASCLKIQEKQSPTLDCACFSSELKEVKDEAIYYESIMAYQAFSKKVKLMKEAIRNDDMEAVERIKKENTQKDGLLKRITTACKA